MGTGISKKWLTLVKTIKITGAKNSTCALYVLRGGDALGANELLPVDTHAHQTYGDARGATSRPTSPR